MSDELYDDMFAEQAMREGAQPPAAVPAGEAPYDDFFKQAADQNRAALRGSLGIAIPQNPESAAKRKALADKTGVPVDVVERNEESVAIEARIRELQEISRFSPILARQLSDPKFAALAHDDAESLSTIEQAFNRSSEGKIGGPAFRRPTDRLSASRGPEASFSTIVAGQMGVMPNTFERIRQGLRLEIADLFGLDTVREDALRQRERVDFRESISTPYFDSTLGRWVYGGAANVQRVVPSIAAGIATRSPAVGLAAMGAQVQPETYGKYRGRGGTPGEAALGSGVETAIEIGTEMLPMGFVVEKFGKAGATQFLAGYLGRELPTELAAEIAQGAVDTAIANPGKTWGDYVAELPDTVGQTVVSTLMMSGGLTVANEAARRLAGPQAQADIATNDAEALAQLSQLAAASKLRARDPQTFQEFVAAANEDGAVQDIYLDARTLQQAGIDPALLARASPSAAEQIEQALATGGDLVIPMAEYAAKIAGTDLDPVLTPHLRTAEDALSLDEAQRFYQGQAEEFQKTAAQVMDEKATDTAWTASAKVVEAKLFEELKGAGRFTDDVNTAYATLMRDFYVATASRLGITPEEMFARYPIKVAAERMAGGAQRMEQLSPEQVMGLNIPFKMPTDTMFAEAVANTQGAQVTENGLLLDLVRYQKPEQEGAQAVRTGVFYLPKGAATVKHYRTTPTTKSPNAYGGTEKMEGQTLLRRPLFVKGATGGKAPEAAYDAVKGKGAMKALDKAVMDVVTSRGWMNKMDDGLFEERVQHFLTDNGGEPGLAWEIIQNSKQGNTLRYALQEHVIANAVRAAGYDAVVGYSKGKAGSFISEVFDVREQTYPARGMESQVHPTFEQEPNPLQRFAQSIAQALGIQTQQAEPVEQVDTGGPALDMGQFFQGQGNRAEIAFGRDITQQPSVITLFANADLSSFLHEMGHFQLEVLANIASRPDAPAEIVGDMEKVLKWFGITGAEEVGGGETAGSLGQPGTDAFARWFGDSKVVDADGRPLVVYHASNWNPLDNPESAVFRGSENSGGLIYFAFTKSGAKKGAGPGSRRHVGEYFVSMKNPLNTPETAMHWTKAQSAGNGRLWGNALTDHPENDGLYVRDEAGVSIAVRDPAQIKSATQNAGTFDPSNPNILRQGDDQTTPDPANLPKRRTALEVWQAMSLEEKRPYHEMFARGFEAYLFEGKAPSQEITGLFARFRAWLINVYKSVKALNVEISDDIRQVFDRLIATDEAIKQAEAMRSYAPLFKSAEEMGDAEMWAEYQRTGAEATQNAVDGLQRRSLRDMQWLTNARGRILKQLQADAKAKRKAVEDEVRAEVKATPVYAAMHFLKRGEMVAPDGEQVKVEKGHRLDTAALAEMYPETMLARPALERLQGMTRKGGLAPDLVAEMFGFTSGDQMVRDIIAATPEAEIIEGMTDQRVLERYGDLANPDTLARAVDEAIHNEARARFVATELKALSKAMTPVRAIAKAAKDFAAATIARKKVRDIKPRQHAAAESRAAKAAEKAMAAGDTAAAAVEKRNQLVQNYSTRLSYEALDEIGKAVKYLRKFDSEGTRKNLDTEYVDQINQLRERFDLRASVTNKAADKRAKLAAWLEAQREQGFEPDIPADLVDSAMRKPYRELTLEELRGLVDTVKQIEHLGRLKQKLLTAKDEREFKAIRDEIAASIEANAKGTRELRTRTTTGAMLTEAGNRFLAMHRKMASVAREMDGYADGGPVWEYFIRSMNAAGDRETTRRADATARLYALVKPLTTSGKMGGKGVFFDTLGMSLNREERIAIALNLGNAGNMQRLLDGQGWTMARLQPVLDTITPEEADFVQAVWDFFESYRPEIGAKERRIYGKEPDWVEPVPIVLGGKTLKGGYYPIKYDPAASGRAEQHADADAAKAQMRGAYTTATTRRSFTKSRAEEVTGRPLLYSLAGLYQGTNEVIHDLSWHEWLIDANRLLRSLDGPIRTHYGPETVGVFKKAIEDIAAGDVPAQNVFERGINHVRTGATIAGLGWNLMTSLLQPVGLTQSMVRIGPGWVAKGMSQWIKAPLDTITEINSKSAMMTSRAQTMQREINEIQNQVRGSKLDPVRATFFVLIQKMQMVADVPTWLGAYEKHIAAGEAEARAVALADQAVLDAQGGGQMKDLSQIQRGHPALKLFTNFYSFFNVAYNLGVEKTKQKITQPKLYPSLALDYLLLYVLPAAFVTVMKEAIIGGADDDEDKLVKKIIADHISYMLGLMVGLREVTAAAQKVTGVEQFKGSYGGPAGLRLFQEIDKLGQQIGQGEADMALFKAANNAAGIVFHYPSGQINRSVEGVAAMAEGKTANPLAVIVGPPKQ